MLVLLVCKADSLHTHSLLDVSTGADADGGEGPFCPCLRIICEAVRSAGSSGAMAAVGSKHRTCVVVVFTMKWGGGSPKTARCVYRANSIFSGDVLRRGMLLSLFSVTLHSLAYATQIFRAVVVVLHPHDDALNFF